MVSVGAPMEADTCGVPQQAQSVRHLLVHGDLVHQCVLAAKNSGLPLSTRQGHSASQPVGDSIRSSSSSLSPSSFDRP